MATEKKELPRQGWGVKRIGVEQHGRILEALEMGYEPFSGDTNFLWLRIKVALKKPEIGPIKTYTPKGKKKK